MGLAAKMAKGRTGDDDTPGDRDGGVAKKKAARSPSPGPPPSSSASSLSSSSFASLSLSSSSSSSSSACSYGDDDDGAVSSRPSDAPGVAVPYGPFPVMTGRDLLQQGEADAPLTDEEIEGRAIDNMLRMTAADLNSSFSVTGSSTQCRLARYVRYVDLGVWRQESRGREGATEGALRARDRATRRSNNNK
jgi:hypothetical protein